MPSASPTPWPLARADLDGFELAGSRPLPCLLLHGFTAAPTEMRPLADALAARGFRVSVPRLPGHGTDVEELARIRPAEWIEAAERALDAIAGSGGRALVAGQSMGGLLALLLAARRPARVAAVATLAAPLWFADPRARALAALLRFTPLARVVRFVPKAPSAIPEDRREKHFTYTRFPVRGILGLSEVMRLARKALPDVKAPLLVLHGTLDRTAPPRSAPIVLREAGSLRKTLFEVEGSRHVMTWDLQSEQVCARVAEFFGEIGQ